MALNQGYTAIHTTDLMSDTTDLMSRYDRFNE